MAKKDEALFTDGAIEQAYVKAGFFGFAGAGKTATASLLMIGTILECRRRGIAQAFKPVYFQATEPGVDFMVPLFAHFEIPLRVTRRKDFASIIPALREAEENGSGYIIDSVTHPWHEFMEAYMRKQRRRYIQFEDWRFLKQEWGQFTAAFMSSQIHAISCARAGYEYEYFEREDGKKELERTGVKLKTEGEFAFEPSLLVHMERELNLEGRVVRTARVVKDRWMVTDGISVPFLATKVERGEHGEEREVKLDFDGLLQQVWRALGPHVLMLNLGGDHRATSTYSETDGLMTEDGRTRYADDRLQKDILLEKVKALFVEHGLDGTAADAKKRRGQLFLKHFGTASWTEVESTFTLAQIRDGLNGLNFELTGNPYFPVVAQPAPTAAPDGAGDAPKAQDAPAPVPSPASTGDAQAQPDGATLANWIAGLDERDSEEAIDSYCDTVPMPVRQHDDFLRAVARRLKAAKKAAR